MDPPTHLALEMCDAVDHDRLGDKADDAGMVNFKGTLCHHRRGWS